MWARWSLACSLEEKQAAFRVSDIWAGRWILVVYLCDFP